ncbi:autorepressor SdpR family transcription factor [Alkalicoccobacillus plakortidis]|uniref:Autorepressor SdpR family transcription factor n=1 Tax=Alkalicoccobacillus plakortidis TaxID=444060 RepID=A0ABT0XH04_9BACI|nr:autorepressor SdpR family transcription factor [Alkalicoccobacillus plakortidis]MCM2674487.1 autorepressor SdpR family transcription factor [Alkalicoccobacillus plakortidis]
MNELFKALNDETRREIMSLLSKHGCLTASEISEHFDMSKPSISHHLQLLKQANLVTADKRGQYIYHTLNTTVLQDVFAWFYQFKTKGDD